MLHCQSRGCVLYDYKVVCVHRKGSTPLFSERPQREKIRQRELELDLKEKKQSLYQSEEKVGHMLRNRGHCSIYKRYFWITGPT